jgi:hypothetical protein
MVNFHFHCGSDFSYIFFNLILHRIKYMFINYCLM